MPVSNTTQAVVASLVLSDYPENHPSPAGNSFAAMSEEAQEIVVGAFLGEYDQSGPPDIPERVRNEITAWANAEV